MPDGYYHINLVAFRDGLAVWNISPSQGWEGGLTRLLVWNSWAIEEIAEGYICDVVSDGKWVVWVKRLYPWWDYTDSEIWAWDGTSAFKLSEDLWDCNAQVAVADGAVAWCGWLTQSSATASDDLFVWRDGVVRQVTADSHGDGSPLLADGRVAWRRNLSSPSGGWDANSCIYDMLVWDGGGIRQVAPPGLWLPSDFRDGVLAGTERDYDPSDPGALRMRAVRFTLDGEIVPWSSYPVGEWTHQFKGQLHAHYMAERIPDTPLPMHGDLTPPQVIEQYAAAGYDFVAITEHYGNNQYEDNPYIWDRTDTSTLSATPPQASGPVPQATERQSGLGDRASEGVGDAAGLSRREAVHPICTPVARQARVSLIQDSGGAPMITHANARSPVGIRSLLPALALLVIGGGSGPATAGVTPLSPWVSWCLGPRTDDGLIWYSRSYDELGLPVNETPLCVFLGAGTSPVSTPVSGDDQYVLQDVDGTNVLWLHQRGPQWPPDQFLELHGNGTTQFVSQIDWDSPWWAMTSGGKVVWVSPSGGGHAVYWWEAGETRKVWAGPDGFYICLLGFDHGIAVWEVRPVREENGLGSLMVWDGTTVETIVADDPSFKYAGGGPSVATDCRWVVWTRWADQTIDAGKVEIWAWDGQRTFKLTDDLYDPNLQIGVDNGTVAWCGWRTSEPLTESVELFVWRNGIVHQITQDQLGDDNPLVSNGNVAWRRCLDSPYGGDHSWRYDVLCVEGASVTKLASDGVWDLSGFRDGVLTGVEWDYDDDLTTPTLFRAVQFTLDGDIVPWTPYSPGDWLHQFKGQLHAHYMAERFPDTNLPMHADLTPGVVAAEYAAAGYDFAAVTEHYGNNQYENDPYIWDRSDTAALGVEHIWDSMEDTASDSHLLGIGFDREAAGLPDWTDGDSAPDSDLMTRQARACRIHEMGGGMAVVAHPNVDSYRWTAGQVAESEAEGVEVYNRGSDLLNHVRRVPPGVRDFSNPLALDVWDGALRMSRQPIWATAGDDYTVPWPQFDGGYVMAVCDTADPTRDDIMWALKCGSFYACKANSRWVEAPGINGYWADADGGAAHLLLPSSDCTVRFATARGGELLPTSGPVISGDNWEYTYAWQSGEQYVRAEVKSSTGISWTQPIFLDRQASYTATWPVAAPLALSAAEVEPPLTLDVADAHLEISTPQSQIGHVYGRVLGTFERPPAPPMGYVGECYEFLPDAPLDGSNLLSIGYEDADVQLLPESALTIYRYDESTGQWQNLATAVDTNLNAATCHIAQLGIYAVSGEVGEDVEPPSVEIVSPADSSSQSGDITVSATASDNNGVSAVRFWLDDISLGSDTYGADGWTRTADLSVHPGGSHVIIAKAEDASGNRSQTAITVNVVSAVAAPAIMLNTPTDGTTFWIWEGIDVSGSWADDDPLALGIIALDDAPLALATPAGPTAAATWQATVELGPYSEGQRQLRAIGLDQHDNRAEDSRAVTLRFFSDMPQSQWAYLDVYKTARAGIVQGYQDGTCQPTWPVTRDQMAVYISRAIAGGDANVPDPGCETPVFTDVPCDHWARKYIQYAMSQGVVEGYPEGDYKPNLEVTRDQMAVYVARSIATPTGEAGLVDYVPSDPRNFPDVASDFWAWKHVEYCVEHGVVQGYEDRLYHPEIVVTRDQMAVYVARAFQLPM